MRERERERYDYREICRIKSNGGKKTDGEGGERGNGRGEFVSNYENISFFANGNADGYLTRKRILFFWISYGYMFVKLSKLEKLIYFSRVLPYEDNKRINNKI